MYSIQYELVLFNIKRLQTPNPHSTPEQFNPPHQAEDHVDVSLT